MNLGDYDTLHKQCGSFGVFKNATPSGYWSQRCLVKVTCPGNASAMVPELVRKLTDLQLSFGSTLNNIYTVRVQEDTLPGVKHKVIEVFAVLEQAPAFAVGWLEANCGSIQIPEPTEKFDTSKLSVGPCAYLDGENYRYVKVRFDGVSIPFYIVNGQWDKTRTLEAITKQTGPALAIKFTDILTTYESTVLERAKERKLNKSGIPEYAQHHIAYWVETPTGVFQHVKQDSSEMSMPNAKVHPSCVYGYQYRARRLNDFILIDDMLYNIKQYHSRRENWIQAPHYTNNYQGIKVPYELKDYRPDLFNDTDQEHSTRGEEPYAITYKDLVKVDDDDTFVKEKVLRTLKAKL